MNTVFWRSVAPGFPSELPSLNPTGFRAREGRACQDCSGSTVMSTVGMPSISIARCIVTTVRWQSGQPAVRSTASAFSLRTTDAISNEVFSRISRMACENPMDKCSSVVPPMRPSAMSSRRIADGEDAIHVLRASVQS